MTALIRRRAASDKCRDEIPPRTLYLLILKTFAVRGRLHGYEIAESILSCSDEVLQVQEGSLYAALQRRLIQGWLTAEWGVTAGNRRARYPFVTALYCRPGRGVRAERSQSSWPLKRLSSARNFAWLQWLYFCHSGSH